MPTDNDPTGQIRYWFNCDNRGEPFDSQTAAAVLDAVGEIKTIGRRRCQG